VTVSLEPLVNAGACAYITCVANPPASRDPALNGGPEIVLRPAATDVHTLNGSIACPLPDDGANVAANMKGCQSLISVNVNGTCNASDAPPDCVVGVATTGSLSAAYQHFWHVGSACSPNNWPADPNAVSSIPRGDPRLITVAITPMAGSFGPGDEHPVTTFAAFYVTGGADAPDGCGTPRPPATASIGNEIWGHFVKFVEASSMGAPSDQPCLTPSTSEDIGACIATLVQ
jgi:hypothetical protein